TSENSIMKNVQSLAGLALIFSAWQSPTNDNMALSYPETRKDTTVTDEYFGTEVRDPYRWLEDDLSEETADWVKRQNEVSFGYLEGIPYRDSLAKRITELWNYE